MSYYVLYPLLQDNKLVQRGLLFAVAIVGASILVTYFLGFGIGFMVNVFLFMGVILYVRRKESNRLDLADYRRDNYSSNGSEAGLRTSLSYVCLACGSNVRVKTCSECGSNMKKAVFE
jgi:hypothetical protein